MPSKSTASQLESLVPVRGSLDFVELASRAPSDGICDPAVDVGFMPAGPVDADFDLRWERALSDLAVDG